MEFAKEGKLRASPRDQEERGQPKDVNTERGRKLWWKVNSGREDGKNQQKKIGVVVDEREKMGEKKAWNSGELDRAGEKYRRGFQSRRESR